MRTFAKIVYIADETNLRSLLLPRTRNWKRDEAAASGGEGTEGADWARIFGKTSFLAKVLLPRTLPVGTHLLPWT
jgi:hypothetical protein